MTSCYYASDRMILFRSNVMIHQTKYTIKLVWLQLDRVFDIALSSDEVSSKQDHPSEHKIYFDPEPLR